MNTGGRGGGRGGAQTKTSHKIFLLEKHKVLSFFFFIHLVDGRYFHFFRRLCK